MILIDLQKAFDTLGHDTLLNKMKCLGFPSVPKERDIVVTLEKTFSEKRILNCGVKYIARSLNSDLNNLFEGFIDKKLSMHFGEDKTKSILFKRGNNKSDLSLIITRNENVIKQHSAVEYLGFLLGKNMSGEAMARMV